MAVFARPILGAKFEMHEKSQDGIFSIVYYEDGGGIWMIFAYSAWKHIAGLCHFSLYFSLQRIARIYTDFLYFKCGIMLRYLWYSWYVENLFWSASLSPAYHGDLQRIIQICCAGHEKLCHLFNLLIFYYYFYIRKPRKPKPLPTHLTTTFVVAALPTNSGA